MLSVNRRNLGIYNGTSRLCKLSKVLYSSSNYKFYLAMITKILYNKDNKDPLKWK